MILNPEFKPRLYQEAILGTAIRNNTLIVLPTGLGKTAISAMMASFRLKQHPESKILFLAPTKPLVQQHLETYKEFFPKEEQERFALFTGSVSPEKRKKLWEKARFIFSTPQGLENDIMSSRISLENVSLLIIDEAHRAQGNYSYVFIAKKYHETARHEKILAMTASPGSNEEIIKSVCENLYIESIEVRSTTDPDVIPYMQKTEITWKEVKLPEEIKKIRDYLEESYNSKLREAHTLGYLIGNPENYTKTTLLSLQGALHSKIAEGDHSYELLKTISLLAEAMKIQHALELVETQTLEALGEYFQELEKQAITTKTKAVKNLLKDINYRSARMLTQILLKKGIEHPKINELKNIITKKIIEDKKQKIIIFTQYRDTATVIKKNLVEIASSEIFVGQAKKKSTGLSQKKQKELLEKFRNNEFQILIATSVAEEGLDIPSVDTVIFYEPIPSAIRTVQRRGRTGRHTKGEVIVLITKGTRDEAYRWSAFHKEKRMYNTLKKMTRSYLPSSTEKTKKEEKKEKQQKTITEYETKDEESKLLVDYREKGSPVIKELLEKGIRIELTQLTTGDYQVNEDVVIEYKSVKDFVNSIIDGRLLSQARELRSKLKPIIIIEGEEDIYSQRRISPEAIRGMIATIIISYQIPIIRTKNPVDTAGVITAIMRRTTKSPNQYQYHTNKPLTEKEQQEYIIASLPGVGTKLAKELLEKFGSIKKIINASKEELEQVPLIGKKKAKTITDLINRKYN